MRLKVYVLVFLAGVISCNKKDESPNLIYSECNSLLAEYCEGVGNGEFCTFGYKWGGNNPFLPAGLEVLGPGITGGIVTYKFEKGGLKFDTHAQTNRTSYEINSFDECYKNNIIKALLKWQAACSIDFEEVNENAQANIRFIIADISQSGIGYPAFNEGICMDLAGAVIFQNRNFDCETLYILALHEIGHVLGLGHVSSDNVMNPDMKGFVELQPGDILGIQSIYGK